MTTFPAWAWGSFGALLLVLLAVDFLVHRGKDISRRSAVVWSAVWIAAGLVYNVFIGIAFGTGPASEYLAAYLIEKSLSLDNLFVFLVIFRSLGIREEDQRMVLLWGIFGALVFRAVFILAGVAAIERWDFVTYIFAAILLAVAWRIAREDPERKGENRIVVWLSRHVPVTHRTHGRAFLAEENGRIVATPVLLAIIAVELTDIMFAVDSIPAALSVTRRPFIIYTSNAFAILGLRALYAVLATTIARMAYLHYGLAAVLAFAGIKLGLSQWVHIPPLVAVAVTAGSLAVAVWASRRREKRGKARAAAEGEAQGESAVGEDEERRERRNRAAGDRP